MRIIDIVVLYLLQVAFTGGLICIFGLVIAVCNKIIYRNIGKYSKAFCCVTGIIGTPIHEFSHALMCIIFGHRINEIKFFQIGSQDGVLGYVNHSYNKKNFYQNIGNFFIGIAPLIVGYGVLIVLYNLLLPSSFEVLLNLATHASLNVNASNLERFIIGMLTQCYYDLASFQFWAFIFAGSFIALHMTLSKADWKGALNGLVFTLFTLAVIDILVGLVKLDLLNRMTQGILTIGALVMCFTIIFLFIALILIVMSFVFRKSISRKIKWL